MNVTGRNGSVVSSTKTFSPLPTFDIDFELKAKIFNQEGDLKFEYNPFRNLRATDGQLKDFRSTSLNLNLNNSVDIEIQESYDGSVNLILNDDLNPPRLVNSRFTTREDDRFTIIDRKGNTDTNIYKEDVLTEVIRLYKTSENIPYVTFTGLNEGGQLKAGNYVFYFKYADADGNESDIIAESGIVSCYVGKLNDPFSTRGGIADELTNKIAKLTLNNLDTSYDYINVYFTRSTGDTQKLELTNAYKILNRKTITGNIIPITVTGLEDVQEISIDELNIQYSIVDQVKTQAQVQNMLFFGNVDKPTIPYKELEDLALRMYPTVSNDNNIGYLDEQYKPVELDNDLRKSEYYDALNVYKYTGYWNKEMYRFAVVFIMKDDTLTPAFNVRGRNSIGALTRVGNFKSDIEDYYSYKPLYDGEGKRQYVEYDEEGFIKDSPYDLENTKGVVRVAYNGDMLNKDGKVGTYPLSIDFNVEEETLTELRKYAKGFFFVRQKRIPTILAQGISIGVDNISFIPTLRAQVLQNATQTVAYIAESFTDKSNQLVHDFDSRLLTSTNIAVGGLLCPEAQLREEWFNEQFTGNLFTVSQAPFSTGDKFFSQDVQNSRHFYVKNYINNGASTFLYRDVKLTAVQDNIPMRFSGTRRFSTRVGTPEEAWKFSWFDREDRGRYATNVIRGAFSGFVGMENFAEETCIVDIHIPGYDPANMRDYFLLRGNSFHPFYAVSDRYDLRLLGQSVVPYDGLKVEDDNIQFKTYRGDCFIAPYTTRIVRNFQDPETPGNDTIIDSLTWKTNYTGYTQSGGLNKEDIGKINRGDVNAVKIGHWATFRVCSNINLCYRANDVSNTVEGARTGKPRSFYPLSAMSPSGESKIPDSTLINVGYNSTTSDKIYLQAPDVPYIRNIFDNRLMFSEIHIGDQFRNGYRVFKLDAYKDLTKQYGAITKILEWQNNLMVIFADGVAMIPINEKMVGAQGEGGNAYIESLQVLPNIINPITTNYGSTWKGSVIATTEWVYGVDTTAKKIWRTNGQKFEVISDFKIQKFLVDNITLTENDQGSIAGLRNVKTHYNAHKQDVMFTFYDADKNYEETKWSLCYNEQLQNWMTRYSWMPSESADISNVFFSFNREDSKKLALIGTTLAANPASQGVVLDSAFITSKSASNIGVLSLKGYDYYKKYDWQFSIEPVLDYELFEIVKTGNDSVLRYKGGDYAKYTYSLKIRVGLGKYFNGFEEVQYFYDNIGVIVQRSTLTTDEREYYDKDISSWFWKHGQAGIFDITTPILPTYWYDKQEAFEFEFVVVDNPNFHKIWDNLVIISNKAEPDSFEFEVVGSSYAVDRTATHEYESVSGDYASTIDPEYVHTYQKGLSLKQHGRRIGNMQYKEDFWDVEIRPARLKIGDNTKEFRLRDKYVKVRVRYSGTELAIITALTTMYTQSYA